MGMPMVHYFRDTDQDKMFNNFSDNSKDTFINK